VEKNSKNFFKDDKEALAVISAIKGTDNKTITVEQLMKLFGHSYEQAKDILERILNISEGLPKPFQFLKKDYINGLSVYKAVEDPKIIGYIMCRLESGISNYKFKWVKKGHIVSIAVDEPYRKRGIGEALLKKAIDEMEAANTHEQVLEVRTTNYEAIHIYEKLGFEKMKTLKKYYHDGADAYLMVRKSKKAE